MKSEKVGQRIKAYMERKEIDLPELAARTDLSGDFLTSVIEDNVYPSLGPLLKIARALDVRLGTFLDDQFSEDPLIMRQEGRKSELSMLRGKDKPRT
jgi:transcriptional regulator with XRE-family HTH domain